MMKSSRLRTLACALLAAAAAGCADRNPLTGDVPAGPAPDPLATRLECTVDVRNQALACTPSTPTGARGDLLVGSQDVYVKLRSANVVFSAGVVSADVSLQNLLAQPMGTTDGTTPAPTGVRVFFSSGPTTTGGTGGVTVQNPDGVGVFTASGQPFFQYDGILGAGATSATKPWRFQLDPGVTTFGFSVLVSAPLPRETGWVDILDPTNVIAPGQTIGLDAIVVTSAGTWIQGFGPPISWATSDSAVATVDRTGRVTGVAPGIATITASDGVRVGTLRLTVAMLDTTAPAVTGLSVTPDPVNAGDSVTVTLTTTDDGDGLALASALLRGPSGLAVGCVAAAPSYGAASGTFTCRMRIPPGAAAGTWNVDQVSVEDPRGNLRELNAAALAAAGLSASLTVIDATPDSAAPLLIGMTITPSTVNAGDSATINAMVTDAGTGVASVSVIVFPPPGGRSRTCVTRVPASGTPNDGTFACRIFFPPGSRAGTWVVSQVRVADRTGYTTTVRSDQFDAVHVPHTLNVVSPTPDITAPTLRSLTLSPAPIARNDTLTITIGVADAGTGVTRVIAGFVAPTFTQSLVCISSTLTAGTPAFGTFQCKVAIPANAEAGQWRLVEVNLVDGTENQRLMYTGDLRAQGYERTLEVTP